MSVIERNFKLYLIKKESYLCNACSGMNDVDVYSFIPPKNNKGHKISLSKRIHPHFVHIEYGKRCGCSLYDPSEVINLDTGAPAGEIKIYHEDIDSKVKSLQQIGVSPLPNDYDPKLDSKFTVLDKKDSFFLVVEQ